MLLSACAKPSPQALGTLEYDRVTLPAPVAERIVAIDVREGQQVAAGTKLLTLERTRTEAQTQASQAEAQRQREAWRNCRPAHAARTSRRHAPTSTPHRRRRAMQARTTRGCSRWARQLVAAADVDRARAAAGNAQAQVRAAQAALDELEHGTRKEQIAQGEASVRAAQAQVEAQQATLEKLDVVAPRGGRVDSIPYKLGDQAPVGAPLVVMLVGDAPYARVYVPETIRAGVKVGQRVQVFIDGRDAALAGSVRMIRSEPSFTPYYALIGKDAARLSYLAEIQLDKGAGELPAGLPARVEFGKG